MWHVPCFKNLEVTSALLLVIIPYISRAPRLSDIHGFAKMFVKHMVCAFCSGLSFLFALLDLLAALLSFAVWTGELPSSSSSHGSLLPVGSAWWQALGRGWSFLCLAPSLTDGGSAGAFNGSSPGTPGPVCSHCSEFWSMLPTRPSRPRGGNLPLVASPWGLYHWRIGFLNPLLTLPDSVSLSLWLPLWGCHLFPAGTLIDTKLHYLPYVYCFSDCP